MRWTIHPSKMYLCYRRPQWWGQVSMDWKPESVCQNNHFLLSNWLSQVFCHNNGKRTNIPSHQGSVVQWGDLSRIPTASTEYLLHSRDSARPREKLQRQIGTSGSTHHSTCKGPAGAAPLPGCPRNGLWVTFNADSIRCVRCLMVQVPSLIFQLSKLRLREGKVFSQGNLWQVWEIQTHVPWWAQTLSAMLISH
jgi:hypothetical protein